MHSAAAAAVPKTALYIRRFYAGEAPASEAKPPDIACKKYDNHGTMNPFEGFGVIYEVAGIVGRQAGRVGGGW